MMLMPRFMAEGLAYVDPTDETWKLKESAPDWAKHEFDEYFKLLAGEPDENGVVSKY